MKGGVNMSLEFWSVNNFGQEHLNIHAQSKCNSCDICQDFCFCFCDCDFICNKYMPDK